MTTAILPIYYLSLFVDAESVELRVLGGTWHTSGLALWGYTSALSMFLVVLVAPVLGAIADLARGKKPLLAACVFAGALATAGISLAAEGEYLLCSAFYVVANFLWSAGNVFYDGFLPELTDDPRRMDAISASGYAVGYVGGGLALLLSLLIIGAHEPIGLTEAGAARVTFLLVALWWVVFTIPLLLLVRESGCAPSAVKGLGYVRAGFGRTLRTMRKVRRLPNLARMLLAFLLYNSGVGTVIIIAAAYGRQELGLSQETLIGCILVIQFLGLPATLAYIALGRKVGTRASILIGLGVYMAVVVYAMQIETATEFWILGILVGLVQGGIQAMSRSLYGAVIPQGMSAEFFGFFSVFNKIGPFFGPLLFAGVKDATGSSRLAILFLITFFVLGFLVLLTVRGERGREEAKIFVLDEQ
jgi:UMF1 family MFS transporter